MGAVILQTLKDENCTISTLADTQPHCLLAPSNMYRFVRRPPNERWTQPASGPRAFEERFGTLEQGPKESVPIALPDLAKPDDHWDWHAVTEIFNAKEDDPDVAQYCMATKIIQCTLGYVFLRQSPPITGQQLDFMTYYNMWAKHLLDSLSTKAKRQTTGEIVHVCIDASAATATALVSALLLQRIYLNENAPEHVESPEWPFPLRWMPHVDLARKSARAFVEDMNKRISRQGLAGQYDFASWQGVAEMHQANNDFKKFVDRGVVDLGELTKDYIHVRTFNIDLPFIPLEPEEQPSRLPPKRLFPASASMLATSGQESALTSTTPTASKAPRQGHDVTNRQAIS